MTFTAGLTSISLSFNLDPETINFQQFTKKAMSSTKTDTDSSIIFMGEQHIVQLHPEQEQRVQNIQNFVQNTPSETGQSGNGTDLSVIPETQVVPETQNTGKSIYNISYTTILQKLLKKYNFCGKLRIRHVKLRIRTKNCVFAIKNYCSAFSVRVWYA